MHTISELSLNECLLTQIWEEGLHETLGEGEVLKLMKTMLMDDLVEARDSVRFIVAGKSREARMAVYQVAADGCINSARAGR